VKNLGILFFLIIANISINAQRNFYNPNTISEIKIYFEEKNWDEILDSLFTYSKAEGRLPANVSINGKYFHNAGIRYKGFSSCNVNYIKNPLNIDLDCFIENQNYKGFTKIKLSNVIHDPSFVREIVSYEIARKYMPSSEANFANLYINDTLIGLYTCVEAVDKNFAKRHYDSKNHSFFKGNPNVLQYPFGQNSNLAYTHGTDTTGYIPYYNLESDTGWSDVLKLIYTLNEDTQNLDKILNIDRTLWMHAFNYTLMNLDSYIGYAQNYYMYMDDNNRFNPILWDLNMTFGSFRESDGSTHFLGLNINEIIELDPLQHLSFSISPRPLLTNLLKNPTYCKMYFAHIRTIVEENFSNNFFFEKAQTYQNLIDQHVENDSNKFYTYSDFISNINNTVYSSGTVDMYPGLKNIVEARMVYLKNYQGYNGAPEISEIQHQPEIPHNGEAIWITVKISSATNVVLAYRFDSKGIFFKKNMYDNGICNDEVANDSIYGVNIISEGHTIQYYIYAQNDSAGIYSPERAEYEFYTIQQAVYEGDIVINEFTTEDNVNVFNNSEKNEGWVELFNNTNENIRLKGMYISDDTQNIAKWAFPDTVIRKRDFLILWENNGELNLNFELSKSEGDIVLAYNESEIIDSIHYSSSIEEKTFGRYPNGIGTFDYMPPSFSSWNYVGINPRVDFSIYPNPTSETIHLEIDNLEADIRIEIFKSNGQKILVEEINSNQNQISTFGKTFDVSYLGKGIYYLRVISSKEVITKPIIIY